METYKLPLQNFQGLHCQCWFYIKIEIEFKLSGETEKMFFYQPKYLFDLPLILYKRFVISLSFGDSR